MAKHVAPQAPKPRRRFAFLPGAILCALVLFCGASGFFAYRVHERMTLNHQDLAHATLGLFVPDPLDVFRKDRLYVLVLGIDYNYNAKDEEYSAGARSDTIMVAALDLADRTVNVVSVPRDMLVTLPSGRQAKINEAYADGGEPLSDTVVGEFLGLPPIAQGRYFDRFLVLKINATKELIDAIGGIDVPVKERMSYDDNWGHLHIHFTPGLHHMNGDQAVSYSRFRHDACGDPCRIARQQQVLQITLAKLKNDKLNDLAHIGQLIGVVNRNVITNLTDDEKRSLAWAFSGVDLKTIKMAQIPYTGDREMGGDLGDVLIPDDAQKAAVVASLLTGPMGPAPTPAAADLAAIAPSSVKIDVENGSGRAGAGAKVAASLRALGYVVSAVGNAPTFGYETTEIHAHSKVAGVGELVRQALALPSAQVTGEAVGALPAATDVTVIVGRDYAAAPSAALPNQAAAAPR